MPIQNFILDRNNLADMKVECSDAAAQNKLEGTFKIGIRPQKHKRSDRIHF
jgi:hypothetical protein